MSLESDIIEGMKTAAENEHAERLARQIEITIRISHLLERPDISALSPLSAIAKDSLELIDVVNKIEIAFSVEIPNAELAQFQTVNDISRWLVDHA